MVIQYNIISREKYLLINPNVMLMSELRTGAGILHTSGGNPNVLRVNDQLENVLSDDIITEEEMIKIAGKIKESTKNVVKIKEDYFSASNLHIDISAITKHGEGLGQMIIQNKYSFFAGKKVLVLHRYEGENRLAEATKALYCFQQFLVEQRNNLQKTPSTIITISNVAHILRRYGGFDIYHLSQEAVDKTNQKRVLEEKEEKLSLSTAEKKQLSRIRTGSYLPVCAVISTDKFLALDFKKFMS